MRRYGFGFLLACALNAASPAPQFTADNQLIRPDDYREWVFLSAGFGMSYGPATPNSGPPVFDNVFVHPDAYRAFLATGKWPEGTIFALEIRRSSSQGSINRAGHFQTDVAAVEFEVKDSARFPQKWAFFPFRADKGVLAKTAKPQPANSGCNACHGANGAVDNTFVQFYPTLIGVAREKGTFR